MPTGERGAEGLNAPGQPIELDASGSIGQCLDGALQYRFTRDGSVLREFSENPVSRRCPGGGGHVHGGGAMLDGLLPAPTRRRSM